MTLAISQSFRSDKKRFLRNELKSWFVLVLFIPLLYIPDWHMLHLSKGSIIAGVLVAVLLKTRDSLIQYRVAEINIDQEKGLITLQLKSAMLGEKARMYQLNNTTSAFEQYAGWRKLLYSPFVLRIQRGKETFSISNRYGFSSQALAEVDSVLKSMIHKTSSVVQA